MELTRLRISGVRCLQQVELLPCAGLNLLLGPNGSGKTSVLEALYLLGAGKSFRFGGHEAVIRRGAPALQVYAELRFAGREERVGFERTRQGWQGLHNGERVADLAELAALVPVVCFSPESHELVSGGAESRRRFLDWIVFHVEPDFPVAYRRYARLLRQRNALLKRNPSSAELAIWTTELAEAGERVAELRMRVFPEFAAAMTRSLSGLLHEMGNADISHKRGWRDGVSLGVRLESLLARELEVGHTLAGPHRADWSVVMGGQAVREQGSRGQQKLVALSAVLVAAAMYRERLGHPPVVALDDLVSELDLDHQHRALLECESLGGQLWVTGTQRSQAVDAWQRECRVFHVEQGRVTTD